MKPLKGVQVYIPRSNVCDVGMLEELAREEVMMRIKAGRGCFGRYMDILCDQKLPMCLRKRMYDQYVIPTMNGEETWTTTKHLEQKLMTAQRAMERRMLNITINKKQNQKL